MRALLRHLCWFLLYGSAGLLLSVLVAFVLYLNSRTELDVWHRAHLGQEFTARSGVGSLAEYLALEERLFAELDAEVYARTGGAEAHSINRYERGSLADPARWSPDWNRSFEWSADRAPAAVLLLHGLSDSPYSLRSLGERLHAAGAHVLGLRIPGHGTAPAALLDTTWQDMAAAVRLGMRHLAAANPNRPVHIVGYSNGAALAVHYSLTALQDDTLPRADRLVLISPEIGVSPMAALAIWQARLGRLLGLEKLAWNEILLEYDPFKYGSFAVNAGDLSHRLTREIQRLLDELEAGGLLQGMPPILALSSIVDATVLAPALVSNLFNRLPAGDHQLVLFDINRRAGIEPLFSWNPATIIEALTAREERPYTFDLVTNAGGASPGVRVRSWGREGFGYTEAPLGLEWPAGVYSLSHVALTFPPDDPLYGDDPGPRGGGLKLGDVALRGERNTLKIGPAAMLRQRWNPFYSYLERRTLEFLGLDPAR